MRKTEWRLLIVFQLDWRHNNTQANQKSFAFRKLITGIYLPRFEACFMK